MPSSNVEEQLRNLRKWQKMKSLLTLQANWRVGLFFHLKPKAEALEKLLKNLDLRVTSFDSSMELLNHLKEKKDMRIIFCDWEPQKNSNERTGIGFLKEYQSFFKKYAFVQKVPVVLATFHFTGNDLLPAIRLGARDVLIMPTTIEILGQKIFECINKNEEKPKIIDDSEDLMDQAEELVRTGNYRAAIKIYESVIQDHGDEVNVLEKQAEAHLKAGQIEEAMICYKKCVAIEKCNVRAYQGLGNCYFQLGMHRNARQYYQKVIELEPDNAFVDHKLGRTYMLENNQKGAQRHFEQAIKRNPHFFEIYQDLANIKCSNQQADEATEILEKFKDKYPGEIRGHIEYAETLIKAERYPEAENAVIDGINQATKDKYEPPVALYNRWGIALRKQHKYLAAVQKYELALKIEPDNPEIHFNIAKAFFESGDKDRAIEKFNFCFNLDPSLIDELFDDNLLAPLHEHFKDQV